jgi:GDPmannose 4,6-dehydratase
MVKKTALICGIHGMDGSHLADFLLKKNYNIFGIQKTNNNNKIRDNSKHLLGKVTFLNGDLRDQKTLLDCLKISNPDEVYNFAANSFLNDCWDNPEANADVTGIGVLRLLESVKECNNKIKIFQSSSSEMFGRITETPVNEKSLFQPKTQYGCSKLFAHWMCKNYRDYYNMFICSGILFNHESERRSNQFVTRKITQGVAKIYLGLEKEINLGNLDIKKDWGYAPDYVEGMWLSMQHSTPDDYIFCTGIQRTIRDFLNEAFNCINIQDWSSFVKKDNNFVRPAEVDVLKGDPSKANNVLKWKPKTQFKEIVRNMIDNDILLLKSYRDENAAVC